MALLLPLALLSACGDESGSAAADPGTPETSATESEPTESSSAEPETPDWPACADVWVAGAKLKLGYRGCLDGDQAVRSDNLRCESGQRIVRYQDRFYGVAGGKIYQTKAPLDKDKGYLDMVRTCRG